MIYRLERKQCEIIKPVFCHTTDSSVLTVSQGHMGEAWVDDVQQPRCGQIILGDFCFFDGDAQLPQARELVKNLPENSRFSQWTFVPADEAWLRLIKEVWGTAAKPITRYATKKKKTAFDVRTLIRLGNEFQNGYTICRIDGIIYDMIVKEPWSWDAVMQFEGKEDFLQRGLGFAALYKNQLAAVASSYSIYDKGLEITIATQEQHRRKGLAKACASALILDCLEKGWYPSWDARTRISLALAEKLGYCFDRAYPAYDILKKEDE